MQIALSDRTAETVTIYFNRVQDPQIRKFLPQKAQSVEEALADFQQSLLPDAASFGRTIYVNGNYAGDVWCYAVSPDDVPQAMVSYCVFEKNLWGRGVASRALELFLDEVRVRFGLVHFGAFTFSGNVPSIRVLEKNGFRLLESFTENGTESRYYER